MSLLIRLGNAFRFLVVNSNSRDVPFRVIFEILRHLSALNGLVPAPISLPLLMLLPSSSRLSHPGGLLFGPGAKLLSR